MTAAHERPSSLDGPASWTIAPSDTSADASGGLPPPAGAPVASVRDADDATPTLFGDGAELAAEWDRIQAGFVDEPRRAVEQADALVDAVIGRIADSLAAARARLEEQWGRGDAASTEDLRVALQRYRAFFQRLLAS